MPQEAFPRPAPYPSTPASGDWSASPAGVVGQVGSCLRERTKEASQLL